MPDVVIAVVIGALDRNADRLLGRRTQFDPRRSHFRQFVASPRRTATSGSVSVSGLSGAEQRQVGRRRSDGGAVEVATATTEFRVCYDCRRRCRITVATQLFFLLLNVVVSAGGSGVVAVLALLQHEDGVAFVTEDAETESRDDSQREEQARDDDDRWPGLVDVPLRCLLAGCWQVVMST